MKSGEEWRIWSMTSQKYLVLNREALTSTASMTGSGEEDLSKSNVQNIEICFSMITQKLENNSIAP